MNGWFVFGVVVAFVAFVWGWCLLIIGAGADAREMDRYEAQRRWFEDQFE